MIRKKSIIGKQLGKWFENLEKT